MLNQKNLAALANQVCPDLGRCQTDRDVSQALDAVMSQANTDRVTVLCGSLYLIGHLYERTEHSDSLN